MIKRRIVLFGNNKDMAKKKRKKNKMPYIIASAMSVLAAAAVGLFFYSGGFHAQPKAPETTQAAPVVESVSEDGLIRKRAAADYPLMPTQIDGVFVSANPYGLFNFYEYADGGLTACTDAQEMDVTVTCSHQEIPAKLHYLQRGDQLTGYGLFLSTLYEDDVRLYAYAFLQLVNMPAGYGDGTRCCWSILIRTILPKRTRPIPRCFLSICKAAGAAA